MRVRPRRIAGRGRGRRGVGLPGIVLLDRTAAPSSCGTSIRAIGAKKHRLVPPSFLLLAQCAFFACIPLPTTLLLSCTPLTTLSCPQSRKAAAEKPEKTSRKAKKDPKAPKRALSAYMFFSQDWRERVKAENPDAGFGEIGKLLGARWKELSDEEKKVRVGSCFELTVERADETPDPDSRISSRLRGTRIVPSRRKRTTTYVAFCLRSLLPRSPSLALAEQEGR